MSVRQGVQCHRLLAHPARRGVDRRQLAHRLAKRYAVELLDPPTAALQGIDSDEIIDTVLARRAPMIAVNVSPRH